MYLASQSPRRRELLAQIGVNFTRVEAPVEERPKGDESPEDYVQRLALDKARAGWNLLQDTSRSARPVLGADTIGVFESEILEKPRDPEHAAAILHRLSDRWHRVLTAVAMRDGVAEQVRLSATEVRFRPLTDTEIRAYWHTGEAADKAGGYAIQGLGAVFVRELRGSYTGVVGLPVEVTLELLRDFQVPWWQTGVGRE